MSGSRPDLGPALSPEAPVDLSVIVPLYNEEDNVALLHAAIVAAVRPLRLKTELLLVDDGSRDATFARALELRGMAPIPASCRLRRNYGQTAAIQAGFDHAHGRVVMTMDGDLQNDPGDFRAAPREDRRGLRRRRSAGAATARTSWSPVLPSHGRQLADRQPDRHPHPRQRLHAQGLPRAA